MTLRRTPRPLASLVALMMCLPLVACEQTPEEFEDAPTIRASAVSRAPATAPPARRQRAAQQRPRGAGPLPEGRREMPADHPPLGSGAASAGAAPAAPSPAGARAPLRWEVPDDWESQKPSNQMRLAQYRIPAAEGAGPALMTVVFLPGRAGGPRANLDRWEGQFGDIQGEVRREQLSVRGLTVHTLDLRGAYRGMGGAAQSDQRLLGAIVEAGGGMLFFKLTGPTPTVTSAQEGFDKLVGSLAPR